jgi:hypothetical protein
LFLYTPHPYKNALSVDWLKYPLPLFDRHQKAPRRDKAKEEKEEGKYPHLHLTLRKIYIIILPYYKK